MWPLLCHTNPNDTAAAMDQQQSPAFFPPIDIHSASVKLVRQVQGLLVINRFRKKKKIPPPSYYSWQSVNNHCFDKPPILPRTLEGIGTVQPLSESVCCRTMVE